VRKFRHDRRPLLAVTLHAGLVEFLGFRRAALEQPYGAEDVEEELEMLRLPVLSDINGEVVGRKVLPEAERVQPLRYELIGEVCVAGDSLPGQGE